ncbi:hypothetical protein ACIBBD_31425 [Streptomyces sp. NPDC051315]|uniref:hypothetical protein n=1 Tax=Streptomyces sp. NPDC051315 TaxID=3365650 RepID=UPI0037A17084
MHQPVPTPRAPLPVLRAVVFAVVGTVLGMSAHHLLTEGPVPWARGAAAAVVLLGLGLAGTRRPRRPVTVVVCGVVAQYGLHLWLRSAARPRPTTATGTPHAHRHGGHAPDVTGLPAGRPGHPHDSLAMTVAHAVVAVLVAVLLHRADSACWTLTHGVTAALHALGTRLATVRRLIAGRRAAYREPGPPTPLTSEVEGLPAAGPVLAHAVVRRGPPPARTARVSRPHRGTGPASPYGRPALPRAWRPPCPASPCRVPRGA